jgi:predicted RND superfamily exporter protein
MIFLPIARSKDALLLYHNLMKKDLQTDLVGVVAMDMGIKNALFDECLLSDAWLVGLGGIFVIICMWLYTSSFFVTLNTIVAIVLSLGMSYFIYVMVFKLKFFPFMNLLVLIVIVGIGSDDAFIFMKIWHCVYMERFRKNANSPLTPSSSFASDPCPDSRDSLVGVMTKTLEHASLSMLVTSLTTAAAFYASYNSSITAVRCFGIFAGTTVMVNYLLMITWFPAAVSISERIYCFSRSWFINFGYFNAHIDKFFKFYSQLSSRVENLIVKLVIEYSLIWIVSLGSFGIISAYFVLQWPKLELPDTPNFRLFVEEHPFEVYEAKYKDFFWFEKSYTSSDSFKLPIR